MNLRKIYVVGICLLCGCSHQLELTNISKYDCNVVSDFDQRGLKVNVVCGGYGEKERMFSRQIADQLGKNGGYLVSQNASNEKADVKLVVRVQVEESGDVSNFFISWPGFLIFTHAWLGYGYSVTYHVECDATATVTGTHIGTINEDLHLTMRHAEFDRTWAAGCGWLVFWTATAFVNGFYVMSYDDDITPLLYNEAFPRLASPVAEKVIKMINSVNWESPDETSY